MTSDSRPDHPKGIGHGSAPARAADANTVSVDDALPLVTDAKGLHMNEQRNKTMIKNEFQHRLILSTLLITLITLNLIIISATLLDYFFGSPSGIFNVFTLSVAVMEVVAVVVVYIVSKRISFHIAGPVYAIERTLGFMREGDLAQRLTLRDGDQFAEVAEAVNEVLETYQARVARIQDLLDGELTDERRQQLVAELGWFRTRQDKQD